MTKANKAALMSAFMFPGAGLFIVGKKPMGALIVAIALMDLSVIFNIITETIEHRIDQLMLSLNSLSGNTKSDLLTPFSASDAQTMLIATILLTVIYGYSIYASWHYGRLIDSMQRIVELKAAESEQ